MLLGMRRVVMLLLLACGCATTAAPYTGTTRSQARWAAQLAWCHDYEAAPGPRDRRVLDHCRYDAVQAQAEDAAERDSIQAQRQQDLDSESAIRRQAAWSALTRGNSSQTIHCTSSPGIGGTVDTRCN